MKRLDVKPENSVSIISACCILHNVCEVHGDEFDPAWMDDNNVSDSVFPQPHEMTSIADAHAPQSDLSKHLLFVTHWLLISSHNY